MENPVSDTANRSDRLRTLFDASSDGVFLHDGEGAILNANEQASEELGYPRERLVSLTVCEVEVGHDPEKLETLWEDLAQGELTRVEGLHRRVDGTTYPVEVALRKIDFNGYERFLAFTRNITERKARERELLERIKELEGIQQVVELTETRDDSPIDVLDVALRNLPESFQLPDLTECRAIYGDEQVSTDRFNETEVKFHSESETTTGRRFRLEVGLLPDDIEATPEFLDQERDYIESIQAFLRAYLDRQEQFDNLQRARERYETILTRLSDFVIIIDENAEISYVSPAIETVAGYEPGDVVGTSAFDYVHQADHEHATAAFADTLRDPVEEVSVEYRIDTADGSVRWIEARGRNYLQDPLIDGLLVAVRDITEWKQEQERFSALVEQSSDLIAVVDENGIIQYQSPSITRILGYESDEIVGDTILQYVHPEDVEQVMERISEGLAKPERTVETRFRFRHSNGTWRWLESRGNNQLDNPAVEGFVVNSRDITERIHRGRQLDAERRKFEHLTEHLPEVVYRADPETLKPTYVNERVTDVYGVPVKDFVGSSDTWEATIHPDDRDEVIDSFRAASEEYSSGSMEYRIVRPDGEERWIRDSYGWERTDTGDVTALVGIVRDITEERQRIVELRQWKRAIDASPTAIYITDTDGRIGYVNEGFEKITGYSEKDAIGATPNILNSGIMPEAYFDDLWETVLAEEDWEEEIINRRKSGAQYAAIQTIAPIYDEPDSLAGFVAIQADITDLRQREQQLLVIDRLLRHDLRNDLTLINGAAKIIGEHGDGEVQEWAQKIVDASDHLLETAEKGREINQILVDEFAGDSIDLVSVVKDRINGLIERYETANVALDLPDAATAVGDERVGLIVDELVENAIVHNEMDDPFVEVTIDHMEGEILLRVADNGPGIQPIEYEELTLERVYDPVEHGEGIGLWLVYWLIQAFDGTLDVQPNDPRGTIVTVRFQSV